MHLIDQRSILPEELYISRDARDEDLQQLPLLSFASKIREVRLTNFKTTDQSVKYIGELSLLERLRLGDMGLSDEGLEPISKLTKLRQLHISGTRVTGRGLVHLRTLTALEQLNLERCTPLAEGLEHLAELPRLRHLVLNDSDIAPAALVGLGALIQVEKLDLARTHGQASIELKHVGKLTQLRSLDLHASELVPAILPYLAPLVNLEYLRLTLTKLKDSDIVCLGELSNLRILYLQDIQHEDALLALESLTKLEELYLFSHWSLAPAVTARLKKAAPKLKIQFQTMNCVP